MRADAGDMEMQRLLAALSEPRRRDILRQTARREMTAGELAECFKDVSRPAISQQLRVLKDAGLLRERSVGARRLYRAAEAGLVRARVLLNAYSADRLREMTDAQRSADERTLGACLDDVKRLARFVPSLTCLEEDAVLNACVDAAAAHAKAPIALITLVMEQIQLFRAARGLPPELELSRATARDLSFCQYVVQSDAPIRVEDTKIESRLPKGLVDTYGARSYLGVPVRCRGQVLGSLCVIDGRPRRWPKSLEAELTRLARKASRRFDALFGEDVQGPRPREARDDAAERALVELGPAVRLLQGFADGRISADELARGSGVLAVTKPYERAVRAVKARRNG